MKSHKPKTTTLEEFKKRFSKNQKRQIEKEVKYHDLLSDCQMSDQSISDLEEAKRAEDSGNLINANDVSSFLKSL